MTRASGIQTVLLLIGFIFASIHFAEAQHPPTSIPRIGYLAQRNKPTPTVPDPAAEAFRHSLRELGYVEGKNIFVEYRYADGVNDRLTALVTELVQLNVDVLISPALTAVRVAKQTTTTIPIVMIITDDPVATGLVTSLAQPGGNLTGVTRLTRELAGKRLELLKEVLPTLSRVGLLWASGLTNAFESYEAAARAMKIQLQSLEISGLKPDIEGAVKAAVDARVGALITGSGGLLISYPKQIAQLSTKNRLPSMHERKEFVDAGGLMSYSATDLEAFRRAAIYVDKILKGSKPADLPIEQPTKFEFIINLKAAKQIGLAIPPSVVARADKVIK
jgi:putative ABC transport system substrate-binding protein